METDILLFNSSESGDFDMPDSQKLDTSLDNCQPTTFSLVKCKHWTSTSATVMDNERPKDDEDFKASFFIPRSASLIRGGRCGSRVMVRWSSQIIS